MIGWIVGVLITIAGIALSYKLDEPTAPVIVAGLAFTFFFLLSMKALRTKEKQP
jgi:ABC-type Mn2+/Zn2+ transport system permease subunit